MLLLLRRVKHQLLMNGETRKYLSYAVGELLLVIVGILIALQIDNWNQERKDQASLQLYLESIAQNMHDDLAEIAILHEQRYRQMEAGSSYQFLRARNRQGFAVEEVFLANRAITLAAAEVFFSPSTSGYDSLSSSPLQSRLQGTGIDRLLSAYYDTARRIEALERSHHEYVRAYNQELTRILPDDMEIFALSDPSALTIARFEELQPEYIDIIQSTIFDSLVNSFGRTENLVQYYRALELYSRTLDEAIAGGTWRKLDTLPQTPMERIRERKGMPVMVAKGRIAFEYYWMGFVNSPGSSAFRYDAFHSAGDAVIFKHHGGAEWASVYLSAAWLGAADLGRPAVDFSEYATLELEMRGEKGGETVQVIIKDAEYPDELAPVGQTLVLDRDWKTYEIDLSRFAPNDLSKLHVPLGFTFEPAQAPMAFALRNARYR